MEDYEKDGILYCANCNSPKQVKVSLFGTDTILHCLCKCETEKRDEEQKRFEMQQRMARIRELKRMGFADSQLRQWTFDNVEDTQNVQIAKRYVDHFDEMKGKGLMFYGPVGTGKSVLAACIVNALTDEGYPCLMTTITKIDDALRGMYDDRQSYIESLNKFSLLVIDDLGAERNTEYMNEVVQNVIDARYRARLPLIVTTNYTADAMKSAADINKARVFSRLWDMCLPIKVDGEDRRRKKMVEDYQKYKGLLGL